jgi:cytochrome c556
VEQSAALRDAIRAVSVGTGTSADVAAAYKLLSATCSACHDVYRND